MERALASWSDQEINEQLTSCNQRLHHGRICEDHFDSPIGLIKHLREIHGFPEMHKPLIAAVVELMGPNYEGRDGKRAFLKMAPYEKDRFCILHVVEFQNWIRVWATEADPLVDPAQVVPFQITVPCPGTDDDENDEEVFSHRFSGKILPFGKYHFGDNDPVEYFDFPKSFAQQFYETRVDGRFELKILFGFGEFAAKELFREGGEEIVILQLRQESEEPQDDDAVSVTTESSGFGEDDEDDDEDDIVQRFQEIRI